MQLNLNQIFQNNFSCWTARVGDEDDIGDVMAMDAARFEEVVNNKLHYRELVSALRDIVKWAGPYAEKFSADSNIAKSVVRADNVLEKLKSIKFKENVVNATYVSVWDNGEEIRTACEYDPVTNTVSAVDFSDRDPDCGLVEEFIELAGDAKVDTFYNADIDQYYSNGVEVELT